jgi:ankyrin repeat protein
MDSINQSLSYVRRFWANRGKTVHMKEIVSLLIEKGADINITDSEYRTPLHQVCVDRNLEIVRHLLDNGANINAKDSDGRTPLFYCLREGHFHPILSPYNAEQFQSFLNNHEEGNKILTLFNQ